LFKRIEMKAIGKNIVIEIVDEEVKTDSGLILSGDDTNKFRYKRKQYTIINERDVVIVL